MAKRRWTIMLVPHGPQPSRILEVTSSWLKLVAVVGVVVLAVASLVGYAVGYRVVRADIADGAQQRERELATQLGQLSGHVSALQDTLAEIAKRDQRIRLLANLDPIPAAVQQAGVGGPALAAAAPRAADPLGRRAEEIRVDLGALVRRANLLARSFAEARDSMAKHTERLEALPSIMPTSGWLTSAFTQMREHPILHVARPHEGIDVTAPMGAPIEAPAAGRVIRTGWETGYGNVVEIDHGYGIVTRYAHCSRVLVQTGQRVARGDRIALVGSTGLATGPHVHYEVHVNGRPVDPLRFVLSDAVVVD